jgi:penicillin-binding protein 1C
MRTTPFTPVELVSPWYVRVITFLFRVMAFFLVSSVVVMFLGATLLFSYFARDLPHPDVMTNRHILQSSKIYDRTGEVLLYEVHGGRKRTLIAQEDIPDVVKYATIAVEDDRFYEHFGFDVESIVRATVVNYALGREVQGGSTITQQLVKNAIFSPKKTYERKIREILFAIQLERYVSKDDILHMYLNEIFYGQNAYGIVAASEIYFAKQPSELTVAEAALLASLPKAPSRLSPYGEGKDVLMRRQRRAIARMYALGFISYEETQSALSEQLAFSNSTDKGIIAAHFVFYVLGQLEEKYGRTRLETGGLRIVTTLDMDKQLKAERAVSSHIDTAARYGASNIGLTAVDPKTGDILAMVGSTDYFNMGADGNVNIATSLRQPGSSFKPYVYAAAFEKGLTPDTILMDQETDFGGGYKPKNYDGKVHGAVTLKQALANSWNIPAVKLGYIIDPAEGAALARRLGVEAGLPQDAYYGPSTSIGAKEVRLVDHVAAFGVFANKGLKAHKSGVLKVTDSYGTIIDERNMAATEQVLDANVANTLTSVLSDNALRAQTFGANSPLQLSRPNAAKTGTTNDFKDAWALGYTPNLAAGVWVGNNDGRQMHQGADGVFVAAPIWRAFMEEALLGMPIEHFEAPEPIQPSAPDLRGARVRGACKPFFEACVYRDFLQSRSQVGG